MPTLDATVSGASANSYLTMEEADERLNEFPNAEKWDELGKEPANAQDTQKRLLMRGTRLIDRYLGWPPKQKDGQRLAFPTTKDESGKLPEEVKLALLEFVDAALEGKVDALKRLQAEGVTSASVLGQSMSFEADPSELPAGARRELDRLLASYQTIVQQNPDPCEDEEPTIFG